LVDKIITSLLQRNGIVDFTVTEPVEGKGVEVKMRSKDMERYQFHISNFLNGVALSFSPGSVINLADYHLTAVEFQKNGKVLFLIIPNTLETQMVLKD